MMLIEIGLLSLQLFLCENIGVIICGITFDLYPSVMMQCWDGCV